MYQHTDCGANDRRIKNTSTKLYLEDFERSVDLRFHGLKI